MEDLIRHVRRLRINNVRLEEENKTLASRVQILEERRILEEREEERIGREVFSVGDRVHAKRPICPGKRRHVIAEDSAGVITRKNSPFACIRTDSKIKIKRHPKIIKYMPPERS